MTYSSKYTSKQHLEVIICCSNSSGYYKRIRRRSTDKIERNHLYIARSQYIQPSSE